MEEASLIRPKLLVATPWCNVVVVLKTCYELTIRITRGYSSKTKKNNVCIRMCVVVHVCV